MIPQINISQTLGQIGLQYQPEELNISAPRDQLTIQNTHVDLSIQTTPAQLSIDQTQAFADEGLRTPLAFSQYQAQQAVQTAENGTASAADWGHRFLHIEKGDPLKQYVSRNEDKQVTLTPALVPSPFSVKISYQPGTVHIHADLTPVQIHADTAPVQVSLTPTQVHTYLAKAPQLQITAPPFGQLIDTQV
jgi:hypothetical protein